MVTKQQITGMTGVYLVATELSKKGLIVSPTSRSAQGADLLVTDANCQRVYAVQVKTNARNFSCWLLNAKSKETKSHILIYVLVNIRNNDVDYYLVPSKVVASNVRVSKPSKKRKKTGYAIYLDQIKKYKDNWSIFEK